MQKTIRFDAGWFVAQVVAALVGNYQAETSPRQGLDLFSPAEPKIRESVKQYDYGPVFRSGLDGVQANVIRVNVIRMDIRVLKVRC